MVSLKRYSFPLYLSRGLTNYGFICSISIYGGIFTLTLQTTKYTLIKYVFFTVHLLVCYISINIPHCPNKEHINFINV